MKGRGCCNKFLRVLCSLRMAVVRVEHDLSWWADSNTYSHSVANTALAGGPQTSDACRIFATKRISIFFNVYDNLIARLQQTRGKDQLILGRHIVHRLLGPTPLASGNCSTTLTLGVIWANQCHEVSVLSSATGELPLLVRRSVGKRLERQA